MDIWGEKAGWQERLLRTTIVGVIFGTLANALNVPLPWMLGPLFGCATLSIAGFRLGMPGKLTLGSRMAIGMILGAAIDSATLARVGQWPLSLLILFVGMGLAITAAAIYYRKAAGYDKLTAVAASLPGGLANITSVALQLGANVPGTVVSQLLRVSLVVMTVPPLYIFWIGADGAGLGQMNGGFDWVGQNTWIVLGAVPAYLLGRLVRLPVPEMLGPMMLATVLNLAGYQLVMPIWLFAATFIVLGSTIGARFYGLELRVLLSYGRHAVGGTALLLTGTLLVALAISHVMDIPLYVALLAVMPGGIAEMAILAAVLGVDPVFVTFHQVFRSVILNSTAPFILRWCQRTDPAGGGPEGGKGGA
ncbi:AbrB family transcriptional regulator [Alkalilacustris brevis]|uniref:AbrB family transcriptional regulator n=1 Tax=Alkalilacustris brevis TaxID=2026338 RepID=UPI000E0CFBE1|nr:AbrB family transcriptional regulator [Alkalilacustris brevis]